MSEIRFLEEATGDRWTGVRLLGEPGPGNSSQPMRL